MEVAGFWLRCASEGGWLWLASDAEVSALCPGALAPRGFAVPRDCNRCGGAG